jgi:hypothetical protein
MDQLIGDFLAGTQREAFFYLGLPLLVVLVIVEIIMYWLCRMIWRPVATVLRVGLSLAEVMFATAVAWHIVQSAISGWRNLPDDSWTEQFYRQNLAVSAICVTILAWMMLKQHFWPEEEK